MSFTTLNERELEILRSGRRNLAYFFRAEFPSGTKRLYAGAGDYPVSPDPVETEGGIYESFGRWGGGMPDIDHLTNAQAQGSTLVLPGVDAAVVRTFVAERGEVVGSPAAFGWGILDERYRPVGPIRWTLRGVLSHPRVSKERVGPDRWRRDMSVTLISGAYVRRRGRQAYLSKGDHRRHHPSDAACDRSGVYSQQTYRPWPDPS